jgi:hypothetical protein
MAPLTVASLAVAPERAEPQVVSSPVSLVSPVSDELRGELAAEVGAAAAALPLDLVDVVAHAWRAFRRGRDP